MRNLKKFLALVMAMVMALSLMVSANAAVTANVSYPDSAQADAAFEEAITVLSGMGVFSGDNGEFYPTRNVTRAEAAALIYRLATGDVTDSQADLYAKYGNFDDVRQDAWYAGYVGYCANAGYIKGRPGNVFDPSGSVTGYEILAMILRVVGYDKNGEFTGADWQVNVSALSQSLGVINNVNSTQYGGTLYLAAQRQVVADLLFQTDAYIPQVVYTTAFGYQQTGMSGGVVGSTTNPTLGYRVFGLTNNYGVVVGNEVTGEAAHTTKIGFSLNSARTASELIGSWDPTTADSAITSGFINTNQTAFVTAIDDTLTIRRAEYDYDNDSTPDLVYYGSGYLYESDTTNPLPQNVTRTFKWDSDLTLFNHKVKVWYDDRSSQYETVGTGTNGIAQFTTNLNTYAVFDKVNSTAIVTAADANGDGSGAVELYLANNSGNGLLGAAATNSTRPRVENNWVAPSMKLRTGTNFANMAYFNYAFGRIAYDNFADDSTSANSAVSPVKKNDDSTDGSWPLYLLISNNESNILDVVIPLDITQTRIVQANNTTKPESVGVQNSNGAGTTAGNLSANGYFGVPEDVAALTADVTGTTASYVSLAQANLRKSPNIALGTKVAAIEITGTAGGNAGTAKQLAANVGDKNWGYASNKDPLESTYYYQLTEHQFHKTATVIKIDYGTQDITLSDGTVLHQSIFAEDTDATFTRDIEGSTTAPAHVLVAGREYTFTLDAANGNYIYWEEPSNSAKFVYGTYIDFTSGLATSSFNYPLVYVGTDGQRGQEDITKVLDLQNKQIVIDRDGAADAGHEAAAALGSGTTPDAMSAAVYSEIMLNKRDDSNTNTAGYLKGRYVGYALDSNGVLKAVTATDSQDTGFVQATDNNFGNQIITINKTDAVIGAKEVININPGTGTNSPLFLTENTQFYLVDGAGTANQKVTPFKGLKAIMEGNESVVINVQTGANPSKLVGGTTYLAPDSTPWDMVYYQAGNFTYAQNYDPSAREIKTVFIPREAVTFNKTVDNTLIFVGDNQSKLISSLEGAEATLFTVYRNGVEENIWIEGYITDYTVNGTHSAASIIAQDDWEDTFYNVVETTKKAADGNTVYTIKAVEDAASKLVGKYFNGTITTPGAAPAITQQNVGNPAADTNFGGLYKATTYSEQVAILTYDATYGAIPAATDVLYNVGNAGVKNLSNRYTINSLADLNNAGSLANNNGVFVSCLLNTSDNTLRTVSQIYVNFVQDFTP